MFENKTIKSFFFDDFVFRDIREWIVMILKTSFYLFDSECYVLNFKTILKLETDLRKMKDTLMFWSCVMQASVKEKAFWFWHSQHSFYH